MRTISTTCDEGGEWKHDQGRCLRLEDAWQQQDDTFFAAFYTSPRNPCLRPESGRALGALAAAGSTEALEKEVQVPWGTTARTL